MIKYREIKDYQQQAYYDYITALLLCGEWQEANITPKNLTIKQVLQRSRYHLKSYDIEGSLYYEIFGVNFQQWTYEKHIWTKLISKWLSKYIEMRKLYGNKEV